MESIVHQSLSLGKLALAALRSAARALKLEGVLEYVHSVEKQCQSTEQGEEAAGNFSQSLDIIDGLVEAGGDEPAVGPGRYCLPRHRASIWIWR